MMDPRVGGFNYNIEHVKGRDNAPSDFLSRVECDIDHEINDQGWKFNDFLDFFEKLKSLI